MKKLGWVVLVASLSVPVAVQPAGAARGDKDHDHGRGRGGGDCAGAENCSDDDALVNVGELIVCLRPGSCDFDDD